MSRCNLYLLYLLVCIEFVYSYDLYEDKSNLNEKSNLKARPFKKKSRSKDRSRVAQFDVASFLQKPDDVEVPYGFENAIEKRRRTSKDYDYEPLHEIDTSEVKKRMEKNSDLSNYNIDNAAEFNHNAPRPRDIINDRRSKLVELDEQFLKYQQNEKNRQELMDSTIGHNLEKKCSFKNMKFPFFSRKTQNEKKEKKRKLFCFNCPKKGAALEITTSNVVQKNAVAIPEKGSLKRSNKERSLYNRLSDKRQIPNQDIHNSRQFYQKLGTNFNTNNDNVPGGKNVQEANTNESLEASPAEYDLQEDFSESSLTREKRSEADDNTRRLKILDEIQRKVDHLEIKMPNYPKMPYETN